MATKYRLAVSGRVKFTAHLSWLDFDEERTFGAVLEADRLPVGVALEDAVKEQPDFVAFLSARNLKLVAWQGDAVPLQDDQGKPAPADAEALAALLAQQSAPLALFQAFVAATGAKAKLGN